MRAPNAISPSTGARLGDTVYPHGRETLPHQSTRTPTDGTGVLTSGEAKSSRVALQQFFEDCYQRTTCRDPPADLTRTAGYGLYRLKQEDPLDVWAWFALQEYLAREGYWATWMREHVEPQCPRCGSVLQIEMSLVGLDFAKCGSRCGADPASERSTVIVDRIMNLYEAAFVDGEDTGLEDLRTI